MTEDRIIAGSDLQIIMEYKMKELFKNTITSDNFNGTKREHSVDPVSIKTLDIIPQPRSKYKRLLVKSNVGSGTSAKEYQATIQFDNVPVMKAPDTGSVKIKVKSGKEHHIMPVILNNNDVQVSCTCHDFKWRFAWYNNKAGALYGPKPKPYTKKTNRPPVNPNGVAGVCKHLIKLAQALSDAGVVK